MHQAPRALTVWIVTIKIKRLYSGCLHLFNFWSNCISRCTLTHSLTLSLTHSHSLSLSLSLSVYLSPLLLHPMLVASEDKVKTSDRTDVWIIGMLQRRGRPRWQLRQGEGNVCVCVWRGEVEKEVGGQTSMVFRYSLIYSATLSLFYRASNMHNSPNALICRRGH